LHKVLSAAVYRYGPGLWKHAPLHPSMLTPSQVMCAVQQWCKVVAGYVEKYNCIIGSVVQLGLCAAIVQLGSCVVWPLCST
jgi:hypothetical protein